MPKPQDPYAEIPLPPRQKAEAERKRPLLETVDIKNAAAIGLFNRLAKVRPIRRTKNRGRSAHLSRRTGVIRPLYRLSRIRIETD